MTTIMLSVVDEADNDDCGSKVPSSIQINSRNPRVPVNVNLASARRNKMMTKKALKSMGIARTTIVGLIFELDEL
ncbi:hypothetical protein Hdeb2414_s0021g00570441 [Helianthus debilis subsp. tardiflorus]